MTAYYNENDPYAAAWLRELIAAGNIAAGDVDERSIIDVRADDLRVYTQCHFFAGIAGWSYALRLADVSDDQPIWTGSCPCQPLSGAGQRKGHADERHLWPAFHRLIAECRPATIFGEQVASKDGREWLAGVRADLETLGYAVGGADLCAASVGAPHIRQRLYWMADALRDGAGTRSPGRVRSEEKIVGSAGGEPSWPGAEFGISRQVERLADADGRIASDGDLQRSRQLGQQQKDGGASGMGDACRTGLAQRERDGRLQRETMEPPAGKASIGRGDFIRCLDGKSRRVEPGIFPLVDGLSRGVVPSGDPGSPNYANATAEARTMRLRGYGNAINPVLAAVFIEAALKQRGET